MTFRAHPSDQARQEFIGGLTEGIVFCCISRPVTVPKRLRRGRVLGNGRDCGLFKLRPSPWL